MSYHSRRQLLQTTLLSGIPWLIGCRQKSESTSTLSTNRTSPTDRSPTETDHSIITDSSTPSPPAVAHAVPSTSASTAYGDLQGRIVFDGPRPNSRRLTVDADREFCDAFEIYDESLVLESNTAQSTTAPGIAHIFIYCRTRNIQPHPDYLAEKTDVLLDNRDAIFKPHALTLWVGQQRLQIVNSDPIAQNVAFSPLGDRAANLVLPPKQPDTTPEIFWEFRRPQPIPCPIVCHYHAWELAYILPHANPYCTLTAHDGTFQLTRLPAGTHELFFWHEKFGPLDFTTTDASGTVHRCEKGRLPLTISRDSITTLAPIHLQERNVSLSSQLALQAVGLERYVIPTHIALASH